MAGAVFAIFFAVLHISGAFNSVLHGYDGFDRRHRFQQPIHRPWDYRTFQDLEKFYSDRLHHLPDTENYFNYASSLSKWSENGVDEAGKFRPETALNGAVSANSRSVSSSAKSKLFVSEGKEPMNRRNIALLKVLPILHKVNMKVTGSYPLILSTVNEKTDESETQTFAILNSDENSTATENVQFTDTNSTEIALNTVTMSAKKETSENTAEEVETRETTSAEEETSESASVGEEISEIATVKKEASESSVVEENTNETTAVEEETSKNTAVDEKTSEITTDKKEVDETTKDVESEDKSTSPGEMLSTSNPSDVPENSTEDISVTVNTSDSVAFDETTLPVGDNTNGDISITFSDSSHSEGMQSTTDLYTSKTDAAYSTATQTAVTTKGFSTTSMSTELKSSSSQFVTEVSTPTPEHVFNIPGIKTARIVISAVFLALGIIATAVLAVYMFRAKRRQVQYDQLTLLP